MSESAPLITITSAAQEYLRDLLVKQQTDGMGVRIFVEKPGTPYAECCMAYCGAGESEPTDEKVVHGNLVAYIDAASVPYLEDAVIDYAKDRLGGQLTFRAPKSKVPQIGENSSVEERINHIIFSEINPQLASHGGSVELQQLIDDDTVAILKFGGSCQGCGMIDVTLKQGVEKTLLDRVPELKRVTDVTDHSNRENAYY
ncbi:Conserved hypothetical protein [gamma proteobacterium HdN1]|nr:Conserved hypothetical protein [gamma proteobacterium HdN1]